MKLRMIEVSFGAENRVLPILAPPLTPLEPFSLPGLKPEVGGLLSESRGEDGKRHGKRLDIISRFD